MAQRPNARRSGKQRDVPLGRIEKLIIDNFKSYSGRHEIGPFEKFSCIIGPNGSGKSNVMDAISFCLGIKAKHLRGDRLKDLVYRREEEDVDSNTRSANVTLVFRSAEGGLLHFGRAINCRGEGSYRCGPPESIRTMGYEDFLQQLANEHIYVKARNFLVFQGDVMHLARRQGTDLTGVLETISGSDQLKEEYTKLSRDLELMQEKARMHFQHRREVEGTVALLEKQRAEVERYQELRARRDALLVETALFRLCCAERESMQNHEASAALQAEATSAESDSRARRKELEDLEAARKKCEVDVDKAQSQHFILSSNVEQLKPDIANCRKQAAHWMAKLREKEQQMQDEEVKLRTLEGSSRQAREDRERAEAELAKLRNAQVSSALEMTAQQRSEYEQAVLKTDMLNTRTRDKLREAEEQLAQVRRLVNDSKQDQKDMDEKRNRSVAKIEELSSEKSSLELKLDSGRAEATARKRQAERISGEVSKFSEFKQTLVEEQQSLRLQLDVAKARRDRLEQLEVRQKVADELRGRFPEGVLGRISELLLPTQKRFDMALQMSLGGMAEAFVVSDAAEARQCVHYLKERRISSETFLPLDRMQDPKDGGFHLLTQGSRVRRLATLCVQHNEKFLQRQEGWRETGPNAIDRTVSHLLNGTIIADSLEEAKKTAFNDARKRGLKPRVVTLDGEVIAPNGNMSVRSLGAAGLVEFGGAEQLEEMRKQERKLLEADKDLATLEDESGKKQQQEAELKEQAREVEGQHQAMEQLLRRLDAAQTAEQKLIQRLAEQAEAASAKVDGSTGDMQKLQLEREKLESELLKLGKKHFQKLNQELGVDDVREVITRGQAERSKLQTELEQFEDFFRQLQAEEQRAEQRLRSGGRLETLQRDLEQYQRDIEAAQKRQNELEERGKVEAERCEAVRLRLREATLAKEKFDVDIRSRRSEIQQLKVQLEDARRRLKKQNEKVRILLSFKCTMFRECSEKLIEVPLISSDPAAMEQVLSREQDLDDMAFQDLEAACRSIVVDYSLLPPDKQELAEQTKVFDAKNVEAEYVLLVAEIIRELEELNPNMRAPEECSTEEEKLREIRRQADEASVESQRLSRGFEAVKAERIARFMKCFKHVEANVHPYYKSLTSYDGFDGGSAYLDLDDAEEPYNGGITFTACPPGKRFFPMELLSGGERSMASMALLFAMHSYQPPPFMILDEVDAPFDRKNTQALVGYLKKLNFQCLVISLKDTFFSHSDSIVGIYKDKEIQSSGSISLALQRLGGQIEEPETEVPIAEAFGDDDL